MKNVRSAVKKVAGLQKSKGGSSDGMMTILYPDYDAEHDFGVNTSDDEEILVPALVGIGEKVVGHMVKDHTAKLQQALDTALPPGGDLIPGMPLSSRHPRPAEDEEPLELQEDFFGRAGGSGGGSGSGSGRDKGKGRGRDISPRTRSRGSIRTVPGDEDEDWEGDDDTLGSDGELIEKPAEPKKKGALGSGRDFIFGGDW
ncbi:hypothetical protein B0T21DRAFT_408753 [Apiosordaria backusii]|uniref:Uncharacterized protein n=1 Tax=Apiosordaria backusii TaxID=314023 RepID=A0AA40K114_9PEZI|nr:hypothetical protein B0T21DRAFT_408753 [Apiosordaria backusii]